MKYSNIDKHEIPDTVIQGGTMLSMVEGEKPVDNVRVFIKDDRIQDITCSDNSPLPNEVEVIDAQNAIIMPGLVNAHAHTAMTIFRGYADDLPLQKWLFEKIFPAEAAYLNPDSVYWGTLLGCLEMIAAGTTGVIDGYFYQDEVARAFLKSGLRTLAAQGVIDFPAPGVEDPKKNLIIGREFIEKWINVSELITPGLFCHSPATCSPETLRGAMDISGEYSLRLQIHLSETSAEVEELVKRTNLKPAFYLDNLGLLNEDLIAAHSIHLDEDELDLLSDRKVSIVHVPESNMKLASGVAKVSTMIQKGLLVGIGTDGCASNNNLDLFKEMDTAAKLGKVFTKNTENMAADTVIRMATSWGAKIMSRDNETGTIKKGKKADLIVVDTDRPHMVPLYNPISQLVYSANGADVKDVVVNGKILLRDHKFQTLDHEEIISKVREISGRIK